MSLKFLINIIFVFTVCILFHTAICGLGLGLGLGTAGLDYKSGPMWSDAVRCGN